MSKSEGNPKCEIRIPKAGVRVSSFLRISSFVFRISFEFRISRFGFQIPHRIGVVTFALP